SEDNSLVICSILEPLIRKFPPTQRSYPQISLVDLYQYPTIDALAKYLTQSQGEQKSSSAPGFQDVTDRVRSKKDARKQRRQRRGGKV
ncbi:MAG: hypothetical protein AAFY16_00300, partial [Cyanobacteria bacterium J06642_3]